MPGKSLLERFEGKQGRALLRKAMQEQQCVGFSADIADLLIKTGELAAFAQTDALMQEGAADKDIYFLVAGLVSVEVNERQVAIRASGQHVGEMALIDPTSLRSATVVALEDTVALRVPESSFSAIANQHPMLWRRLAAELAGRSRASNKFIHQINERPVLFLASAADDFTLASLVKSELSSDQLIVRLWKRNAFAAGRDTLEEMHQIVTTSDLGVIISSDELLRSANGSAAVHDNMLLEVGMSTGVLGHARTLLVTIKSNGSGSPDDRFQVLSADLSIDGENPGPDITALCKEIRNRIQYFGPR